MSFKSMKFNDLLANMPLVVGECMAYTPANESARELVAQNPEVITITNDSRKAGKGSIFVAIKGFDVDAHDYLADVAVQGAVAAFVLTPNENLISLPQFVVDDTRLAYALLHASLNGNPSRNLHVTGITGSNGKTGTSMMLRQIYLEAGRNPGLLGTVVYSSNRHEIISKLTTPDAGMLQELLREMHEDGQRYIVMESSSIGQEQRRDAGVVYNTVACINVSREHIDHHGSFEAYVEAKSQLIRHASSDTFCVLNADDPECCKMQAQTGAQVFFFGIDSDADLQAHNLDLSTAYGEFELKFSDRLREFLGLAPAEVEGCKIKLAVPGRHTVANALAAGLMALLSGVDIKTVIAGLQKYHGVERRFQEIYAGQYSELPFKVFDDHFANAGNIEVTLKSLVAITYNNLHIVYALRGKRGVTITQESLETFFNWHDQLKVASFSATLSEDVVDYYNEVSVDERACFEQMMSEQGISYTLDSRLADAAARVFDLAQPGDLVLLAGCQGMDAGARIFLEQMCQRYPELDPESVMKAVADRVCGRP